MNATSDASARVLNAEMLLFNSREVVIVISLCHFRALSRAISASRLRTRDSQSKYQVDSEDTI